MAAGPLTPASSTHEADGLDSRWVDEPAAPGALRGSAWRRWLQQHRLAVLAGGTLVAVALLLVWLHALAARPHLPGHWAWQGPRGLVLQSAPANSALASQVGRSLVQLSLPGGHALQPDADWLAARPRWIADDARRTAWQQQQQALMAALAAAPARGSPGAPAAPPGPWLLQFDQGERLALTPAPRGLAGLGLAAWALHLLSLGLVLSAWLVVVTRPGLLAGLYAVLAMSHALLLAIGGAEALPGLGQALAGWPLAQDIGLVAEAAGAAALVHLLWRLLRPHALPGWLPSVLWTGAALAALVAVVGAVPAALGGWWLNLLGLLAAALLLRAALRLDGTPLAGRLQGPVWALTLGLLAVGLVWWWQGDVHAAHDSALRNLAPLWVAAAGAVVLAGPLLARPHQAPREWAMVQVLAALALVLALLLSAGLELDWRAALALALMLAASGFAALQPLIDRHLAGVGTLSAERLFDSLYRAARAMEQAPQRSGEQVAQLLREVFDPLEVSRNMRPLSRVRVARDGSAMAVPVPELDDGGGNGRSPRTVLLRHARRGQRLFTEDDRQLAERLLEQLRRAVAYDRAVERGRAEERSRIAQDLHDDIGARLLTLMYKAPDSEIEEYIRHTLQDLKTLTRGLAASDQRLSHAAAEWKADISQRLHPSGSDLHWSFTAERDITLNVVQWSGLTRVLRELVNNILAHAQATQVEVALQFDGQWLALQVCDDGIGRAPDTWSHGLGLGGVRKRVKQLGGQVQWREHAPRGIRCEIRVLLDSRPDGRGGGGGGTAHGGAGHGNGTGNSRGRGRGDDGRPTQRG